MAEKNRVIEKIISEMDWYVIERVRFLRKNKFSQSKLSVAIGFAEGFIGRIENPNQSAVYSLRHINLIATALKVSIDNILPKEPLQNDLLKLTIQLGSPTKTKVGETNYEILKKEILNENEIFDYHQKMLNRAINSGKKTVLKKRKGR